MLRHELWRDEAQAWCIALQSRSIPELFYNMRYEMHPALWHLILFSITRVTHNPLFMQLVHVGIISGAVFLFTRYAPFTRIQKILFTVGYFPLYEYGVISRSYSIVMLLLFSMCTLWPTRSKRYLPMFVLLALLANTNAYGFLLSAPVAATLVLELLLRQTPLLKDCRKVLASGIAVYVIACGVALMQLLPPPDGCSGEWNNKPVTVEESRLTKTLGTVWASYVPIPDLTTFHTWNTNVLAPSGLGPAATVPLSLALVFFSAAMFFRKRMVLFLYTAGTGILLSFAYLKLLGGVRQQGHLFELLLIGFWLAAYYPDASIAKVLDKFAVPRKWAGIFCTCLLFLQALAGIYSYAADLARPFSASALVANYLKKNHLTDKLIIGTNDHEIIPISALIDKKIYYPESETFGSFVRNDRHRHTLSFDETFTRIKSLMVQQKANEAILITNYQLGGFPKDIKMDVLKIFDKAIQPDEIFYIYSMSIPEHAHPSEPAYLPGPAK